MKQHMYGLAAALILSVGLLGAPQDTPATGSGPMAKLRTDLATAVKNANLNDSQKKTLQDAGARLKAAGQARQDGNKVDRGSVKKALEEIRKVAESGAFQPDDAAAVKADLDALKQASGRSRRRGWRR